MLESAGAADSDLVWGAGGEQPCLEAAALHAALPSHQYRLPGLQVGANTGLGSVSVFTPATHTAGPVIKLLAK